MKKTAVIFTAIAGAAAAYAATPAAGQNAARVPAAAVTAPAAGNRETAIFAGGCFWGVEGVFDHVKGVVSATSGYAGGSGADARYERVSAGSTGHAEAVRVVFDPSVVSYADLLRIYFSVVTDPTEVDRQGPDEGTQYRTALFPQGPAQARIARAYLAQLSKAHVYRRPIATRLERGNFYPAEQHHQNFLARNPHHPYIVVNDAPKVAALRKLFPQSWKS